MKHLIGNKLCQTARTHRNCQIGQQGARHGHHCCCCLCCHCCWEAMKIIFGLTVFAYCRCACVQCLEFQKLQILSHVFSRTQHQSRTLVLLLPWWRMLRWTSKQQQCWLQEQANTWPRQPQACLPNPPPLPRCYFLPLCYLVWCSCPPIYPYCLQVLLFIVVTRISCCGQDSPESINLRYSVLCGAHENLSHTPAVFYNKFHTYWQRGQSGAKQFNDDFWSIVVGFIILMKQCFNAHL